MMRRGSVILVFLFFLTVLPQSEAISAFVSSAHGGGKRTLVSRKLKVNLF